MFFTAIHQMMTESVDLTIVIRKTNGQLTVSTLPKSNGLKDEAQNHIVPLTVTGTPQELDTGFLQAVTRPIQKACGLISNMAQFEAQADKAAASSKAAKDAKSKETKEEREKREKYEKLMKKAEELTGQKPPGSRQRVYTGKSTRECRPAEGNRGEDKGGRHGNEPGKPLRPDGTGSTAGTFCTAATAGIHTGNGTEKSATATSATAGTAADIHAETVTTDAGTGSARTAETTTGIHAASATARNMAVATTAAGKTADTAARAICPADRRTAVFPTSISAAA